MMTSSKGNGFRVTGPSWGESTGDLWCQSKQTAKQTVELPVIWDGMMLIVMINVPVDILAQC